MQGGFENGRNVERGRLVPPHELSTERFDGGEPSPHLFSNQIFNLPHRRFVTREARRRGGRPADCKSAIQ